MKAPPKAEAGRPTPAEIGELVAEGRGLPADPRLLTELTDMLDSVSEWESTARRWAARPLYNAPLYIVGPSCLVPCGLHCAWGYGEQVSRCVLTDPPSPVMFEDATALQQKRPV